MNSKRKNYTIIMVYGVILIALLLGFNNLYGSNTDWISQHSVIPEYFRQLFYETKNPFVNFAFNLGAGQNIFNYSYYGLFSPIILISYFLPFIDMTVFIIGASIVLYLISGMLIYKFLINNHFEDKMSLFLSLSFLTLAPLTFHFHHHIMFVWYMPFLIMSLMGVDRYVDNRKSLLLIISVFLIIMTNYYYSVTAIIVVLVYGVYKLLGKSNITIKSFFKDVLAASVRVIIPVLLSGIILIPTAYVILNTGRTMTTSVSLTELLMPNLSEIIYKSFSMGLSALFLLAPLGLLCVKNKKKDDIFLSICLLVITFIPIFMYALNGFLYIRGKVLIPFVVLYILDLAKFICALKNKDINIKAFIGLILLVFIFLLITEYRNPLFIAFTIDLLVTVLAIKLFIKYRKEQILYFLLLITLLVVTFSNNKAEKFVTIDRYKTINTTAITNLLNYTELSDYYRIDNYNFPLEVANKVYNSNYYNTSLYSSNYNNYYWNFYNFEVGNNIAYRNVFVTAGTKNPLFNKLMGVKYVISSSEVGLGYSLVKTIDNVSLYENKHVYPMIYATSQYGSISDYSKLKFPYNIEYMLKYPVTNDKIKRHYNPSIKQVDWNIKGEYQWNLDQDKIYEYNIKEPIKDKILIITFDMEHNQNCSQGDTQISINGVKNKLTCKEWMYHNQNNHFEYVISSNAVLDKLKIEMTKGQYSISNLRIYTMDNYEPDFISLDNLKINKAISKINGEVSLDENGYIITSLPFDRGFSVYVDHQKVKGEIVNTAFLGFKVPKGDHNITIKYTSPGYMCGCISSITGLFLLVVVLICENIMTKKQSNEKGK